MKRDRVTPSLYFCLRRCILNNTFVAISTDGYNAYHGSSPEELIEDMMNDHGEITNEWEFYKIEKSQEMKLSLG